MRSSWLPQPLGMQFNTVYQNTPGFRSPYLARLYARYVIPLSGELGEPLTRGISY